MSARVRLHRSWLGSKHLLQYLICTDTVWSWYFFYNYALDQIAIAEIILKGSATKLKGCSLLKGHAHRMYSCSSTTILHTCKMRWQKENNLASQSFPTARFFNNNIETIFYYFTMDFIKKTGAHLSFKHTP